MQKKKKKKKKNVINPVIMKKCQMLSLLLSEKILSLSNLSLFESETMFSRKIIS